MEPENQNLTFLAKVLFEVPGASLPGSIHIPAAPTGAESVTKRVTPRLRLTRTTRRRQDPRRLSSHDLLLSHSAEEYLSGCGANDDDWEAGSLWTH